jgi:hypothetical protein
MITMGDIVRELNTPAKRDRIVVSPATSGSDYITVEMKLHRAPFVYGVQEKHFSFQQIAQAVAWAKHLAAESSLLITGNWPKDCGLPGGNNFADWGEEPSWEAYRDLIEPEEPAACLRFLHRWGKDASTREKFPWQSTRDPTLPEWACTQGERFYSMEVV